MICRNDHCYASRAQKPHFCVKTTKNLGKIAHSDTKTSILCSKGRKMGVPKPKSAQKCRFCARRASQNSTERLSGAHRTARRSSAEHGTVRRDPGAAGNNHPKQNKTAWDEAQRPEAQGNATATQRNRSVTHNATATATPRNRHATAQWGTTKKETTFRVVSFKNWRLPTLPHGSAVPSAQVSLTSLFGMGRGGSSPLLPP